MMLNNDSIEIIEEHLNSTRTHAICQSVTLVSDKVWGISIRNCIISDQDYEKLIRTLKKCKLLRYLNLNINLINSFERVNYLTTLLTNLSYLDTLCLHSSNLKDEGLKLLYYSLTNLKNFRSLDIGDCKLTDNSVNYIKEIIHRKEHTHGLSELILSYNPKITPVGWSKILIAVASSSDLKYFYIDYNNLDDNCGYLIVSILCSNHTLEILDLEHTGLTNKTGVLLSYLFKNYQLNLKSLNLMLNQIDAEIMAEIDKHVDNEHKMDVLNANTAATTTSGNNKTSSIAASRTDTSSNEKRKMSSSPSDLDIKIRDQVKLDEYVKKAELFNKTKDKQEYERHLEREFKNITSRNSLSRPNPTSLNDSPPSATAKDTEQKQDAEFLKTFDNYKFKTHTVLPFNLDSKQIR